MAFVWGDKYKYAERLFPNNVTALSSHNQILDMRSHSGGILAREALMHYKRAVELGVDGDDRALPFIWQRALSILIYFIYSRLCQAPIRRCS